MTILTDLTPLERAVVERIPREQRCPGCAGYGFVVQSRWSWRWRRFERHERVTCLACEGAGRMRQRAAEGEAA